MQKILIRLFAGLLVLSLAAGVSFTARAAGQMAVGYVPLLSSVDPNTSIQAQSMQAFLRLSPRLLALKKAGLVSEFEPELAAGMLKVKYSASADLSAALSVGPVSATVHPVLASVQRAAGRSANSAALSASGPNFDVALYGSCFSAVNLGASSHILGTLRTPAGRVVSSFEDDADSSGLFYGCFPWDGAYADVVPGYKLTFKVYDTSAVLLGTYSIVAPQVKFLSFDNGRAVVAGTAPKGKLYDIGWQHENLNAAATNTSVITSGKVSSSGVWSKDFGSVRFRGGDNFFIDVHQNAVFSFYRFQFAPFMYCVLGSNYCQLFGLPFQSATISVVHGGKVYTFHGTFGNTPGYFEVELLQDGAPVFMKAGDKVSGTSVATYALPTITAAINYTTNTVHGKVPPNKYFSVYAYDLHDHVGSSLWTHSTPLSRYSADFTGLVTFDPTHAAALEVYFRAPSTGNVTDFYLALAP